ncbi:MAG: hypothetical protein JSS09_02965, partial [Verrucomicrobia bacterium]|nr:hypothetical protein [Verrucomicrobiota bacterium]
MNYINKMFSHFMRNVNLSTKSLKGNEAKATKIALLSIGSFGSWYLMQKFHPSKLIKDSPQGLKKEISIEKQGEIKALFQKNPTEITEGTENENEQEVSLNYSKWIEGESFFDNLENYYLNTMNPGAFIEKIKTLAVRDPSRVSQYIQNYGITDQKVLIEIAKIAAAQNRWGVSNYIQNYGITDQKALIEIAKIAAAQNGEEVSLYIQNYGITDQKALIEIAKIAAAQDGLGVSYFIQNYEITDQKDLIGIAKIAAAQSGWGVSRSIQNYGIKDPIALIEIAKIAAAQNGSGVSYFI